MSARRVLVIGAGKRVRETALPAFASLSDRFEIAGIRARTGREAELAGRQHTIRALDELQAADLAGADLVYVAVGKDALPGVLARLAQFDRSRLDLLIDTPVVRFKHLRHARLARGYRTAAVAEDAAYLPWFETVRRAVAAGAVGRVQSVLFDRSAYAYHGIAMAKALLGPRRVVRARRRVLGGGTAARHLWLDDGLRVEIREPRDYAVGRILVRGDAGCLADRFETGESGTRIEALDDAGRCSGVRIGDVTTRFDPQEIALCRAAAGGTGVIARMEDMKRIGFRRLLFALDGGADAYPIDSGLEDMAVDWFLERVGRWRANALFDVRAPLARALWGAVGRLG